jgi:hypothetical protein
MADDDCRMTALKCLLSCRTWPFNCGARVCASNGSFELVGSVTAAMAACTADCVSTAICSGDFRLPESGPKPPGIARPSGEAPALNDPLGPEKLSYIPAPPRLGELSFWEGEPGKSRRPRCGWVLGGSCRGLGGELTGAKWAAPVTRTHH